MKNLVFSNSTAAHNASESPKKVQFDQVAPIPTKIQATFGATQFEKSLIYFYRTGKNFIALFDIFQSTVQQFMQQKKLFVQQICRLAESMLRAPKKSRQNQ